MLHVMSDKISIIHIDQLEYGVDIDLMLQLSYSNSGSRCSML